MQLMIRLYLFSDTLSRSFRANRITQLYSFYNPENLSTLFEILGSGNNNVVRQLRWLSWIHLLYSVFRGDQRKINAGSVGSGTIVKTRTLQTDCIHFLQLLIQFYLYVSPIFTNNKNNKKRHTNSSINFIISGLSIV